MRATRVVHVRLCCTGTLWLGNAAYLYLSVSFIQMLKALMPVAVFCTGCTFGIESFSIGTLANMVINILNPKFYIGPALKSWKTLEDIDPP